MKDLTVIEISRPQNENAGVVCVKLIDENEFDSEIYISIPEAQELKIGQKVELRVK